MLDFQVQRVQKDARHLSDDCLAIEEPLEIRAGSKSIAITMRTPGHDDELAAGFLFTEGLINRVSDIKSISGCGPRTGSHRGQNILRLELNCELPNTRLDRNFYTTSSCGICGKASLEALSTRECVPFSDQEPLFTAESIHSLPSKLRDQQSVFEKTGGLHAAALVDGQGTVLTVREDVGRHNAVDKVIGAHFLAGKIPLGDHLLFVSGRASFELMQKALIAGIPALAAVGAPSSLAVELARRFQMTLLGFVRDNRFNIYSGDWRIK